jgi:hypothetical protein
MSESPETPKTWVFTTVGDICASTQYGYTASASEKKCGPRFLRIPVFLSVKSLSTK